MKKVIIGLFLFVVAANIIGGSNFKSFDSKEVDTTAVKEDSVQEEDTISLWNRKGLNEIRFANFTDKDWCDNEYIRSLRKYLDDYNQGKVECSGLDPYKRKVRGKFVIGSVEPFLVGGLFIKIVFVDYPEYFFSSWVYSSVDTETETILDYSVRGVKYEGKSGFTKEDIKQFLKENPEQKMW